MPPSSAAPGGSASYPAPMPRVRPSSQMPSMNKTMKSERYILYNFL